MNSKFNPGKVEIGYLIDYPEYLPELAQWLFEQWGASLGEESLEPRMKKLQTHLNRDRLPIAWVAHAGGQVLGTVALRVHDLDGHEDLTPWLGGVFVSPDFRHRGIGTMLCAAVEDEVRARGLETIYLFTLDKQAWYSSMGWTTLSPCVWQRQPAVIMSKRLLGI